MRSNKQAIYLLLIAATFILVAFFASGCRHCEPKIVTEYQRVEVPIAVPCPAPAEIRAYKLAELPPDAEPAVVVTTLWRALYGALAAIAERDAALSAYRGLPGKIWQDYPDGLSGGD